MHPTVNVSQRSLCPHHAVQLPSPAFKHVGAMCSKAKHDLGPGAWAAEASSRNSTSKVPLKRVALQHEECSETPADPSPPPRYIRRASKPPITAKNRGINRLGSQRFGLMQLLDRAEAHQVLLNLRIRLWLGATLHSPPEIIPNPNLRRRTEAALKLWGRQSSTSCSPHPSPVGVKRTRRPPPACLNGTRITFKTKRTSPDSRRRWLSQHCSMGVQAAPATAGG